MLTEIDTFPDPDALGMGKRVTTVHVFVSKTVTSFVPAR